jgi:hypothetical protein
MFNYQPVNKIVNSLPSIYSAQLHFNYFYKWAEFAIYNTDKTVSFTSIISSIASPNALIALDNGASFSEVNDFSFEAYATGFIKLKDAGDFRDYIKKYELKKIGLDSSPITIGAYDFHNFNLSLKKLALNTGKVTSEEAKKFTSAIQVLALKFDEVTKVEDALKFDNIYQIQALNLRSSITIEQALQFKDQMQVRAIIDLPLSYRYISTEELLKFDNDDQVSALIKCSHLSYDKILQFTNPVQAEACEDGSLSFEDSLKFSFSSQLRAFNDFNLDIDKALQVTEMHHLRAIELGINIDYALQFICLAAVDSLYSVVEDNLVDGIDFDQIDYYFVNHMNTVYCRMHYSMEPHETLGRYGAYNQYETYN